MALVRDVSERKLNQERVARAHKALANFAKKQKELSDRLLNRVRSISCESEMTLLPRFLTVDLKNPLIGTNRVLDLLLSGQLGSLGEEQSTVLKQLKQSNKNLIDLLQNLILAYRLDDLESVEYEHASLNDLLDDCLSDISPICRERRIELNQFSDPGTISFDFSPSLMRRALQNLLDNALKDMQAGGRIEINTKAAHGQYTITIAAIGGGER